MLFRFNEIAKTKTPSAKSFLFLLLGFASLQACKPTSKSTGESEALAAQQSLQNMRTLIESGLTQLDEELQTLDKQTSDGALGLTGSNSWGKGPINLPFRQIFKNVSAAWSAMQANPCKIWTPILRSTGVEIIHPYFFTGASVEAGAGLHGILGRDYVWDLYNLQISAFNYKALEVVFGSGTIGAGVNTYVGMGFGRKIDVNDAWSGKFSTTGFSGSLPVLSDYLSGHIAYFSAQTPQGRADHRFVGGSVGISASVSAPTAIPGAVQIASGNWIIDKRENQRLSQQLARHGVSNSMAGSGTCQGRCVRIDNLVRGAGYTGRAVNLARSLPVILMNTAPSIAMNGMEKIMLLAIAMGAYRDNQNNVNACRI